MTVTVLVLVVLTALLSIPGVPGHDQAALSAQLLASDAGEVASRANPFGGRPADPCDRIESSYGVGNDLLKDSPLDFYASIWPSYQADQAFYLTSIVRRSPSCLGDLDRTLTAVNDNYWSGGLHGVPAAYDQGPAPLHFPGDLPRIDDSMWMGVTLLGAYRRTRYRPFLERAEAVFALARANWDPRHGGIYWEDHAPGANNQGKAVAANGPAAVTALGLSTLTGRRTYLAWGERIVSWLNAHLLDRADGLYDDQVDDHRSPPIVSGTKYTYNQGIMVAALAQLATLAPRSHPLSDAVSLARRAMEYFGRHHSYGDPAFDAVWARYVLWLAALDHDPSFTAEARASVAAAVRAEPAQPSSLLDEASEISLHDLQSLPPSDYGRLAP